MGSQSQTHIQDCPVAISSQTQVLLASWNEALQKLGLWPPQRPAWYQETCPVREPGKPTASSHICIRYLARSKSGAQVVSSQREAEPCLQRLQGRRLCWLGWELHSIVCGPDQAGEDPLPGTWRAQGLTCPRAEDLSCCTGARGAVLWMEVRVHRAQEESGQSGQGSLTPLEVPLDPLLGLLERVWWGAELWWRGHLAQPGKC